MWRLGNAASLVSKTARMVHIIGPIPAKKNAIRAGRKGGRYREDVAALIDGIVAQLNPMRPAEPLEGPVAVLIVFLVHRHGSDGDGKETTILDALKKARWIVDDNTKRVAGVAWSAELVNRGEEGAWITVTELAKGAM